MKKTNSKSGYWNKNCKVISTGVTYNMNTKNYYVRKGGSHIGTYTNKSTALKAYKTA